MTFNLRKETGTKERNVGEKYKTHFWNCLYMKTDSLADIGVALFLLLLTGHAEILQFYLLQFC